MRSGRLIAGPCRASSDPKYWHEPIKRRRLVATEAWSPTNRSSKPCQIGKKATTVLDVTLNQHAAYSWQIAKFSMGILSLRVLTKINWMWRSCCHISKWVMSSIAAQITVMSMGQLDVWVIKTLLYCNKTKPYLQGIERTGNPHSMKSGRAFMHEIRI
jgi:hypothetical protein